MKTCRYCKHWRKWRDDEHSPGDCLCEALYRDTGDRDDGLHPVCGVITTERNFGCVHWEGKYEPTKE